MTSVQQSLNSALLTAGQATRAIRLWGRNDRKRKRPHDTLSIAVELGGRHLEPAVSRTVQAYRDFIREQAGYR